MGASQYPAHAVNNSYLLPYSSTEVVSQDPFQARSAQPSPQFLPPLQRSNSNNMQESLYEHQRNPAPPGPQSHQAPTPDMSQYSQASQAGPTPMYSMTSYPSPSHVAYPASSAMMPPSTLATASHSIHPPPIAPAPRSNRATAPVLRPMPPHGGLGAQPGVPSPYVSMQQAPLPENEQPTHVVGSQGRRGILPSAPGRPQATTGGAKTTVTPQKDGDGKFPCPHCPKTYLHAKHLKRHLLRHTGDRPYMCILCRDTFSRSDILKRHFTKCCIRRGNPQGVTHLSHSHAHIKKNPAAAQQQQAQVPQKAPGAMGEGDVTGQMNGLGNIPTEGMHYTFPAPDSIGGLQGDQNQMSRANSLSRLDSTASQDRATMPPNASVTNATSRPGSFSATFNGGDLGQQMPNYNMPAGPNGMPMYGGDSNSNHQSGLEWFQSGAQHHAFVSHTFHPDIGQNQIAVKLEHNVNSRRAEGAPGERSHEFLLFAELAKVPLHQDAFTLISNRILGLLSPSGAASHFNTGLCLFFTSHNIKVFLDKYIHLHVHFPILHPATLRVLEGSPGLVAAICCVGACYSDRVSPAQVRQVMDRLREVIFRTASTQYRAPVSRSDTEELQAFILIVTLLLWNGNPSQREYARQFWPVVVSRAREMGLFKASADSTLYSPLHQPDFDPRHLPSSSFDWHMWVHQEEHARLAGAIMVCDAAMGLYFNLAPCVNCFEMSVPLPSDDAAWDATSAVVCAEALGLHGPSALKARNPDGTQRCKQPYINRVLQALLHSSYDIQPGTTNLYGKFVLIHAILGLIRQAQLGGSGSSSGYGTPPPSDWITSHGQSSASNSGRATPVDDVSQILIPPQTMRSLLTALEKFKATWDADMTCQFPPLTSDHRRRHGFSRDGIHFYWLAKYMLEQTRPAHLYMAPDRRLAQVMQMLKSVKTWVMSDSASRGEEPGSVGDIDSDYGVGDLTLDMAGLFKPLPTLAGEDGKPTYIKTEPDDGARGLI